MPDYCNLEDFKITIMWHPTRIASKPKMGIPSRFGLQQKSVRVAREFLSVMMTLLLRPRKRTFLPPLSLILHYATLPMYLWRKRKFMADKWLIVSCAGLGWTDVENRGMVRTAGLDFMPAATVFPAVTCTVQASFRTATLPREHGMTSNGIFCRHLRKAAFWEQSADLVEGPRIWKAARAQGRSVALFFWQQSLGEEAEYLISPAPIHKHEGGMILENYTKPGNLAKLLDASCGTFPLHRYWGPLASPKVGNAILKNTEAALQAVSPDILFLYLPTLDYDLQRFGPRDTRCDKSFSLLKTQLERLSALAEKQNRNLLVFGDYSIGEVSASPAFPNRTLRQAGLLTTRQVRGMAYPDLYSSRAFAMVDHEVAPVYVRDPADVSLVHDTLMATGEYESVVTKTPDLPWGHASAGDILLTARPGSWCAYPWWTDNREAPDYATHIDIHSKPGYDPCELLFGSLLPPKVCLDATRIRGTHGRQTNIAFASSSPLLDLGQSPSLLTLAASLSKRL